MKLVKSQTYAGTLTGFSKTGGTSLDLDDIAFGAATQASFSGGPTSGVLTVTDGTHTARIRLSGAYSGTAFTVSSDGTGGTWVVDPGKPEAAVLTSPASSLAFVAAMARVSGKAGEAWATAPGDGRWQARMLAAPVSAVA